MRTGLILVSHGEFAKAALGSAQMITGEQEDVVAYALHEETSLEALQEEIHTGYETLKRECDRVLVVCDIYGGTPFNALTRCMLSGDTMQAYTGLSLPLLIDLLLTRNQDLSEEELEQHMEEVSKEAFKKIILPDFDDEDEEE